ncbi:MAG: AI-2E family transporter [Clostridiaceae bacterium]
MLLFFPFLLGGCIAFILNIPVTYLSEKLLRFKDNHISKFLKKHNRGISIAASCLIIAGAMALVISIIIPNVIETAKVIPNAFDASSTAFQRWIDSNTWLSNNVMNLVDYMGLDWNNIFNNAKSMALNWGSSVLLSSLVAATGFASATIEFILAFIFSIYILMQTEKLGTQVKKILYAFIKKEKADSILEVLTLTSETFSNFITGQCTVAAILGVIYCVIMTILNLPYALVISILLALFSIIPVLGSIIGFSLGVFLILMVSPIKAGVFVLVFIAIKQLEDNFIYPNIVGNSIGLPSIWVLVAITIGGKIFGVAGMITFIPLFSVAYVLFRREVYMRLAKKSMKIE